MIRSWNEVTIKKFKDLTDIMRSQDSEEEKVFRCTALLAGMDYDDFLSLPINDAHALVMGTEFLYTEPKPVKVKNEYVLNGRTYRLMKSVNGMAVVQYINYQSIAHIPPMDCLPQLMSIVLVPEGMKYGELDEETVIEEVGNLKVEEALGIANFFTASFEKSMRRTAAYLEAQLLMMKITYKDKDKEKVRAHRLMMDTLLKELRSTYGFLSSKPSAN